MGQSVSQNKRLEGKSQMNVVQAILQGIQKLNNLQQDSQFLHEEVEEESKKRRPSLQVNDQIRPRKKSWFYYDEQQKQQTKKQNPVIDEVQLKFKLDLLELCKNQNGKDVKNLITQISTLVTHKLKNPDPDMQGSLDLRGRGISVIRGSSPNTIDFQMTARQDFLKLPQSIEKQKKKPQMKKFDSNTNLLDFFRSNKKSGLQKNNFLKRQSSASDYQDLLSIMGTQKKMQGMKKNFDFESQEAVFQRKIQKDLLKFLSMETPTLNPHYQPNVSQLDSSILLPDDPNHLETTFSLVTSVTQKPLYLNFDQINQSDHIEEEFLSDGGCLNSPTSALQGEDAGNKTMKILQEQLNNSEKRSSDTVISPWAVKYESNEEEYNDEEIEPSFNLKLIKVDQGS